MSTHARNLPEGSGQPAPPPPPPDMPALAAEMIAATRAARQANAVFVALELDAESTFAQIYAAWDVAAAADRDAYRAGVAYRTAARWQEVRATR
jgi:hypothetical protein